VVTSQDSGIVSDADTGESEVLLDAFWAAIDQARLLALQACSVTDLQILSALIYDACLIVQSDSQNHFDYLHGSTLKFLSLTVSNGLRYVY
jgi:hypothetical protein